MLQDPGIESERQSTGRKTGFELGAIQPVHASGSIGQGSPLHRTRAIESPQFLQSRESIHFSGLVGFHGMG